MYSNNKLIRDVADVAARIMSGQQPVTEKLHPNQQKLDVHEPEKDELTADDFKKLRGKKEVKKEEIEMEEEQLDELSKDTLASYEKKSRVAAHKHALASELKGLAADPAGSYAHKMMADKRHAGWKVAVKKLHTEESELDVEQIDEASRAKLTNYISAAKRDEKKDRSAGIVLAQKKKHGNPKYGTVAAKVPANEEVEAIDEIKLADLPVRKIQGRAYGASTPEPHAVDTMEGPRDSELKKIAAEKKKKKFSEMVNLYQDKGLKSLSEMLAKEEVTEDEFNKEIEDAKEKNAGKKKNTEIAKGAVQAVKNEETHTTVEFIDLNDVNGVRYSEIELAQERTLTPAETDKKEEIVKSMKKGLSGFKDRYGDRAKEVMYATATARAKGE
jgi:hypothetical protein